MNNLEKKLKKLEKKVKYKYDFQGAIIILIKNNIHRILNKDIIQKDFLNMQNLENYICNNYDCKKYVFISFDITSIN
ncbi:MAG: hypothetical protein IJ068_00270 [Bacilli bacterium]|nr:hypothetical protein [Bacilli bacterium]